jgi:uncharacterized protein YycO
MIKNSCIYIGQYKGVSLVSKIIRTFTWSDISHTSAFMLKRGKMADTEVIEAWVGGVKKRPWYEGHAPGTKINLWKVACTQNQKNRFYKFMENEIGKAYDYRGLVGFVARSGVQHETKWFCSELVFAAARYAGIRLLHNIETYKVSPALLDLSPLLEYVSTLIVPSEDEQYELIRAAS